MGVGRKLIDLAMPDPARIPLAATVMLLILVFVQLGSTAGLYLLVSQMHHETIENRRIGCINRYLSEEPTAPECKPFITAFRKDTYKTP